jgi:hypothetical protein
MESGPPRRLETFVGLWIPPACREEVLGDLHEKYTGPWQYILLALCVIPFVILSRIRRTTDTLILLTEALIIYGSFLAAAWYTDRTLLDTPGGLQRLAIPTALNLVVLILERAWNFRNKWWQTMLTSAALISIGLAFNMLGECASMLLVAAVELLSRPGTDMPQSAAGPALWLKQRAGPAVVSEIAKSLLAAAALTLVTIGLVSIGSKPGILGAFIAIALLFGSRLKRSGKR